MKENTPTSIRTELVEQPVPLSYGPAISTNGYHGAEKARVVWTQRGILGRFVLYGLIASAVVSFLIPVRYTSTVQLMPPDSSSGGGLGAIAAMFTGLSGSGSGLGDLAGDLLGMKSSSDIFAGILQSRTTEDKLIQQFNLRHIYHTSKLDDARKVLESRTNIEIDRKSQIIKIEVSDHSPQRAEAMAQAYVDELNTLVAQLSTSSARRERIFLEGRLKQVNADLSSAEQAFSQFASKNATLDIKEQGKAMLGAAASLQGQLIATESELQGLKQIYADDNVRVRSLTARVAELQNDLNKLGGSTQSVTAESTQGGQFEYPSIRELPLLGVRYADLYRENMVEEAVFETLTKQYEMAKVEEAKEIPTVKVLDAPDIPEKKSFPPRTLIVAMGVLFAALLGTLWIFLRESWNQTDPSDPRKILATEMGATIRAHMRWTVRNGHR